MKEERKESKDKSQVQTQEERDDLVLEKSSLFAGLTAPEARRVLQTVSYSIRSYDKGEIVFHLMEEATRMGIILEGRIQAQKSFPNGSQVNVASRCPGDLIGPMAAFSQGSRYPCDMVSLEPATRVMLFYREDFLLLLQRDMQLMKNFISHLATTGYMLQKRLELLSYSGIAQKVACYLLTQQRQTNKNSIPIPDTISNWALIMNVSRSSLHRELKGLQEKKILTISAPYIEILDLEGLQEILSG